MAGLPLFSGKWFVATLLVVAAVGVMARLGVWQLDRLAQRRVFNARVSEQFEAPALELADETVGQDLYAMEYRTVTVNGTYDHSQQVALRNQVWNGQPGVNLLTPLEIAGSDQAVLVNRGWIPQEDAAPGNWAQYDEPGQVMVTGVLRRPQSAPDFGGVPDPTLAPGETGLNTWNIVNLERIKLQVEESLLNVYIQQAPDEDEQLPYASLPEVELTEGPHQGYAIQWFIFAAILAIGYPIYVRQQTLGEPR